jgi:hypothetical protein
MWLTQIIFILDLILLTKKVHKIRLDLASGTIISQGNQYFFFIYYNISNRELTTKAGLSKNLCHQCPYDYDLKVHTFFPRCYDLSDSK